MPPTFRLESDARRGEVMCKCLAAGGTKSDSSAEEIEDEPIGTCPNLPENIGTRITHLDLSSQGLESLVDCDLPNLTALNLSNNELTELPDSLKRAEFLRVLNVSSNKLKAFPSVLRGGLYIIRELNLSNNDIGTLPRPDCYQHLKVLKARNARLQALPYWVFYELHFLEVLDLSMNGIFDKMTPLAHRSLHRSCNNLLRVNLSNTYLSDVHSSIISHLHRLQYLDVSNYSHKFVNTFSGIDVTLPPGLKVFKAIDARMVDKVNLLATRVEKVNLSRNTLAILNELNIAVTMRFLVLSDCFLSYLPDNFGDMVNLVYLNLSNNDLSVLPESFSQLTALIHLDLYQNSFMDFPYEQLQPLKVVSCFDMCANRVAVPEYPFGEDSLPYETLRTALRSALTSRRISGKLPDRISSSDDYSSSPEDYLDDEEQDGEEDVTPPPVMQTVEKREEEEEEDWDEVDPNAIYSDPSLSMPPGSLSRMRHNMYDWMSDDEIFQINLSHVPARIRQCPFFFYRTATRVVPPASTSSWCQVRDTVVEGQFDDA